ncbi:MAG: GAF domain-containing protein [Thermodesulfobacteriota bacterium]
MEQALRDFPFRCTLSLRPLIDYWEQHMASSSPDTACMVEGMRARLAAAPELWRPIEDRGVVERHQDLVRGLLTAAFPPALWDTEPYVALVPFCMEPVLASPAFRRLLLDRDGTLRGRTTMEDETVLKGRIARAYLRILEKFYGISVPFDYPTIRVVPDLETGLDRYFRMRFYLRFVDIKTLGELKPLTQHEKDLILAHLTEPQLLREILPPEGFEFQGLTLVHAVDVTESEVLSALERDLIDQDSFFSQTGFLRLQQRLRTLYRRPDLLVGLAALHEDQVLLLNTGCQICGSCFFSDSRHVPMTEFQGSVYHRAVREGRIIRISDLREETSRTKVEEGLLQGGVRSMLVAPLTYQGSLIGTLELSSPLPGDLGPVDALLMEQILPLFSMALKRAVDEVEHQVQTVIKEKCTAVHPAVEWRFRKAAFRYLDCARRGQKQDLEPIVFRDVYPLYGISDIRASSEERNRAIQADLSEHLTLALAVVERAADARPQPILQELAYRISKALNRIQTGMVTGDELSVVAAIRKEVEPLFSYLAGFGPEVIQAIDAYASAVDPQMGSVYTRRRGFEDSVSTLTHRISTYVDVEEAEAQAIFPHYFEKHRTDGLYYLIYLGQSLVEDREFNLVYLENFRLWQLMVACGIAWHTERLKPSLKVPLETTHLILFHQAPISIRFRYEEKRFDVDGAYDVRHEILKARLDKATVKGRGERLTQPGRIAVVYSHLDEAREARRHIDYLQAQGYLTEDLESLEVEDLPGVQGLRALRVEIDLDSPALSRRIEKMMS